MRKDGARRAGRRAVEIAVKKMTPCGKWRAGLSKLVFEK
jgi:hypothetical protein